MDGALRERPCCCVIEGRVPTQVARAFLFRRRRVLVVCLLFMWVAGAACFLFGPQSIGFALVLVSSAFEAVVFLAVPTAAAAEVQFDGSYARQGGTLQEPVDAGRRPPAEIRPR